MSDPLKPAPGSPPSAGRHPLRLGKNVAGYFGENIDIDQVLADCRAAAQGKGWAREDVTATEGISLVALTRPAAATATEPQRIYLSTGIHGDEPAGPLAARQLLQENQWPANAELWFCPCLNPAGFRLGTRANPQGHDLNRQYLHPSAPEIAAHIAWLQRQPRFDLCLCLHEDWEAHGFYLYELNPDGRPSFAKAMIQRVSQVCPVDYSEVIEGRPAEDGIIRPHLDPATRPEWPESFFLLTHKTRVSYTLEAPSDFPLATRVAALVAAVRAAVGK